MLKLKTKLTRGLAQRAPNLRLKFINTGNGTSKLLTGEADLALTVYAREFPTRGGRGCLNGLVAGL